MILSINKNDEGMMKTILAACIFLSGCAGFPTADQLRSEVSSGYVGCPANEIHVSDHTSLTWTAECRGKVFYCRTGDGTACTASLSAS